MNAFIQRAGGSPSAGIIIGIGAIAGMTSVLLVTFSGQARIFRAMSRDGLLPRKVFAAEHPRYHSPHRSLILTGLVASGIAAFTPSEKLLDMVAIGTLLAFAIVCAAVLVLRNTNPEFHRPFRCPAVYVIAPLGIAVNVYMMLRCRSTRGSGLGVARHRPGGVFHLRPAAQRGRAAPRASPQSDRSRLVVANQW